MKWNEIVNHWALERTVKRISNNLTELNEVSSLKVKPECEDIVEALQETLKKQLSEVIMTLEEMSWAQCEWEKT